MAENCKRKGTEGLVSTGETFQGSTPRKKKMAAVGYLGE